MWFGPNIYYIFSLSAPSESSLFDTSKRPKCKSFPRGASDTAPELQNGAHGAEKWREWIPPGSPRLPKALPMPPKMLQKNVKNQHPSPGVSPRVPRVPHRPQNTSISHVPPTGVTPSRGNVRTFPSHSLLHSTYFLLRYCEASLERGGLGVSPLGYKNSFEE